MALTYSYNVPTNSYYVVYNSCTAGAVVIPSTYNDGVNGLKPVGGINDGAFSGCTSITSIVIPNSVTYLGDAAFDGCTNLSSVTIGTGVTSFSYLLFQNCTSLINLTVPSNILSINPESFYGCSNLINININSNNPNYTSVDGVVFNKNITTLVLYPIGKIGSYSIPNTVTSIGSESFLNCTNLTNIIIPDSVTSIGATAFQGCSALTTINIPNSVTSIGATAFGVCSGLTTLIIGSGVTSIGQYVFYFCTGLTRVTIPNTVTSIQQQAFWNCTNLNNITISKNVTTIGTQTFRNCTSLTRINFLGNAPTLGTDIFLDTNINLKVYRYSTKSGWSSTFGGKDVLLIDSPATGLETFGFGTNSLGQASVKKTNVGSGRLTLSKFDPKNISDIALWTKQGSLDYVDNQSVIYLSFNPGAYSEGDIDTDYYPDDDSFTSYTGVDFGFKIIYDNSVGLWYLIDPNTSDDIAFTENLLANAWYTYSGLDDFELNNYDVDAFTSTGDTLKFTWSDVSGKNNHLTSRPFPRNNGINSAIIGNYFSPSNGPSNLETKALNTPLKTTNPINLLNPFTIYMVLFDGYTGTSTRRILGISSRASGFDYSNLYLESTASGAFDHTFSLKYYNSLTGLTQTAFSVNLNKSVFASSTYQYGSSILKLSSTYNTTSGSPIRNMTLTYYNLLKNTKIGNTPNIGSAYGTGNIIVGSSYAVSALPTLYISSDSYGKTVFGTFLLSEVLIYNKFLNNEEDGSITRYLQRKYYGKLLP